MKRKLSSVKIIALGFFIMIAVGTALLMLPFATVRPITLGEAAFTATSASCVTGLIVVDTGTTFTLFGQIVLLVLIQTGGLGFMTIAILFLRLLRKRVGLREKSVISESLNSTSLSDIPGLVRFIFCGTAIIEGAGAVLLAIRFVPMLGWGNGLFYALFHSVSAFCNAGFDLMGSVSGEYSSLSMFADDPLVSLTVCALILLGGLGFFVWRDLVKKGFRFRRWSLHSKIVLTVNLILVFVGTLLFFLLENDGPFGTRLLHAVFDSVTPRTAGFNTVDTASLSGGGKLLTIFLMLIGGSPGSTAGGIKTTTIAVLILFAYAQATRSRDVAVFGRTVRRESLEKATAVFFYNLSLAVAGALVILILQPLPLEDILFETFSAIDTVGMTTGITRSLTAVPRILVAVLMFLGRVGSTSFALALMEKRARPLVNYPPEDLSIG